MAPRDSRPVALDDGFYRHREPSKKSRSMDVFD
jgi:hypothetical protein